MRRIRDAGVRTGVTQSTGRFLATSRVSGKDGGMADLGEALAAAFFGAASTVAVWILAVPSPTAALSDPAAAVVPRTADALPVLRDRAPRHKDARVALVARSVDYELTFWNVHTKEVLPVGGSGEVDPEELSHFLRCRVTNDETEMANEPFRVAVEMARRFESERVHVISGFRSPKFNEMLRKKGHEVATRSRHLLGQALDFKVPEVGAAELAAAAGEIHVGGIGTYRTSGFIHVDVGPERRWNGR